MIPKLSSKKELTEEEEEINFKRAFTLAFGTAWRAGFYETNATCPFLDNPSKKWFNWGVEDGRISKVNIEKNPELNIVKKLTCLRCGKKFFSQGERICSKCESIDHFVEVKEVDEE